MKEVSFVSDRQYLVRPTDDVPGLWLCFDENDGFLGLMVNDSDDLRLCISREAALRVANIIQSEWCGGYRAADAQEIADRYNDLYEEGLRDGRGQKS